MVKLLQPSSILEVGAGTGHLALELSHLTSRYVAVEPSKGMMLEANDVLRNQNVTLISSTVEELNADQSFDLVVCHMCLQAIGNYIQFLSAVERHLAKAGVFLISIPHPVFFNEYKKILPAEKFDYMREQSALIDFAITLDPEETIRGVPYFHRPVSKYLSAFANAGLLLTYMEEIIPSDDIQALYGRPWATPRYILFGGTAFRPSMGTEANESLAERLLKLQCKIAF